MKSKTVRIMMICMMAFLLDVPVNVHAETVSPKTEASVSVRADQIGWVYKTVDGKRYKRLYNYTTKTWIGDWIPV